MGELASPEDPFVVGLILGEEGLPEQLEHAFSSSPPPVVVQDDGDIGDNAGCDPWSRDRGGASSSSPTVGGDDDGELSVQPSCRE